MYNNNVSLMYNNVLLWINHVSVRKVVNSAQLLPAFVLITLCCYSNIDLYFFNYYLFSLP